MEYILCTRDLLFLFAALLAWSVFVQIIGAYSYNGAAWNYRNQMNIDATEHQHRLWSLSDNQIIYYTTHFSQARRQKRNAMRGYIRSEMPVVVHPRMK